MPKTNIGIPMHPEKAGKIVQRQNSYSKTFYTTTMMAS
jgi:hypothetical protein